jgi:adenine deaminase
MFGTDVEYMDDPDPTEEYRTPAHRFSTADHTGCIAPGFDADLVFLGGDPSRDITVIANVKCVLLRGRVLRDERPAAGTSHRKFILLRHRRHHTVQWSPESGR